MPKESTKVPASHSSHYQVAYNVQTAVDEKHKLMAEFEVVSEGDDRAQLFPMAQRAQQQLEGESLTMLVDRGYISSEQAALCEQAKIVAVIPVREVVNTRGKQYFSKGRFTSSPTRWTRMCSGAPPESNCGAVIASPPAVLVCDQRLQALHSAAPVHRLYPSSGEI